MMQNRTELLNSINNINMQLQGEGKLICDMQSHVKSFAVKLCRLPITQNLLAKTIGCISNQNMCGYTGKVAKRIPI